MSPTRPDIPRPTSRAVRVEAGHRCAIPTCRATSGLQIHHIDDWAKVQEHAFENLILLCANCHSRVTAGEIDRQSVVAYKANLSILASRYGDLERRVLDRFVSHPELSEIVVDSSHTLLLDYLISDGLIEYLGAAEGAVIFGTGDSPAHEPEGPNGYFGPARWGLTGEGQQFVDRLRQARQVE